MESKNVIVRFPPSPTGLLHIGGVRTALYNYLYAQQNKGKLLLRIEDTDKERSKKEYEEDIINGLEWLGISYANKNEIWRQSDRTEIYKNKIKELIEKGFAYVSKEEEGENKEVIRFKNPNKKIVFNDLIRGDVETDTTDLKDFIIAKNINEPLYHLTVVVDDMESAITHIIRGEDHISNTPRQILILEALGGKRPIYAHLPLVLAEDKSKLSKRKHGESVSLKFYREKGYEPEAILNFLALIGWNPGTDKEIFNLEELIETFDISKVQKKGGIFNIEKLNWINREHILKMKYDKQFSIFNFQFSKSKWKSHKKSEDQEFMKKLFNLFIERIHRWEEVSEILESGEFDYLFEKPKIETPEKICWKNQTKEEARDNLEQIINIFESESQDYKEEIYKLGEKVGKGEVFWPLRFTLSGKEKSPDPISLINILGIKESKERIQEAIKML